MAVLFLLLVACISTFNVKAQKKNEDILDLELWNLATNFILQFHAQWPIRRVVIVYHPYPGKGRIKLSKKTSYVI